MFDIKRKRNGEVELSLKLNPWQNLLNFFTRLDLLFSKKIFYLLPTGLGIGFGLGIVIFSQPANLRAGSTATLSNLAPKQLLLVDHGQNYFLSSENQFSLVTQTWHNENVYFANWSGQADQFIIASSIIDMSEIQLGETLQVLAENQGLYTFHVYHLKEMSSQNINQLKNETEAKLILIRPTGFLGTTAQTALAK